MTSVIQLFQRHVRGVSFQQDRGEPSLPLYADVALVPYAFSRLSGPILLSPGDCVVQLAKAGSFSRTGK